MNFDDRMATLDTVSEFRDRPAAERATLAAAMREEIFRAGEVVIAAGEMADRVFVLSRGRLAVSQPGRAGLVRELERGALLGELAFFAEGVRTATVQAVTECELLSLSFDNFREFLLAHPHSLLALTGRIVRTLRMAEAALIAQEPTPPL